jgi:F-type H+-transporting ATPase subunit b
MQLNATLIGQAIVFAILYWFTWKFIWPHLLGAIAERQKKIADGLAAADRGQKDLDEAKKRAEDIVREARDKALGIVDQASRRSNELVDEAKQTAAAEGNRLVTAARAEIATESGKARDELKAQVGRLAVAGAAQLLGREVDAQAHADLLEKLAAEIERR